MSILPPRSNQEAKFQYCNYGRNKDKYPTFEDCMKNSGAKITRYPFFKYLTRKSVFFK